MTISYRQARGQMTITEFRAWRQTEEGLFEYCLQYGFENEQGAKLRAITQAKTTEAWEIALSIAKEVIYDRYQDEPDILRDRAKRESLERACAERQLIELFYVPPTYTRVCRCENCSYVPVPPSYTNNVSASCPWCDTDLGIQARARREFN